jgi:hypothetical protein
MQWKLDSILLLLFDFMLLYFWLLDLLLLVCCLILGLPSKELKASVTRDNVSAEGNHNDHTSHFSPSYISCNHLSLSRIVVFLYLLSDSPKPDASMRYRSCLCCSP